VRRNNVISTKPKLLYRLREMTPYTCMSCLLPLAWEYHVSLGRCAFVSPLALTRAYICISTSDTLTCVKMADDTVVKKPVTHLDT
jgi:hypothetical protein